VKTGLVVGLIGAVVFIVFVFGEMRFPSDSRLAEKAAVVLMGLAFIPLSIMIFHTGERS
jgi:purine-cytosine permease-like protein